MAVRCPREKCGMNYTQEPTDLHDENWNMFEYTCPYCGLSFLATLDTVEKLKS